MRAFDQYQSYWFLAPGVPEEHEVSERVRRQVVELVKQPLAHLSVLRHITLDITLALPTDYEDFFP